MGRRHSGRQMVRTDERGRKMTKQQLAQEIADDFIAHLDEWYSLPETWDNDLDMQIHRWYLQAPNVFPKYPYFSPSASNADPRELYYKAKKYPKDSARKEPHQGRWTDIGTRVGDMIQRTVLAMERNLELKTGDGSRFRFERNADGTPMFEEFSKKNHKVEHKGKKFYLFGLCDGIMHYYSEEGEILRVGLEVKSKQTTAARTSFYSMREPDPKHVKQCISYGEMYQVDLYIILYVNTSHKSWSIPREEYEKSPDIRAFGIYITEEMKEEVFDYFASIVQSVEDNQPLPLDITKWTFNPYKEAIAKELSPIEMDDLKSYAKRVLNSNLPEFKKKGVLEAVTELERLRENGE